MNFESLEAARDRVRAFLLPRLLEISDAGIIYSSIKSETKSEKVSALARSSLRVTKELLPDIYQILVDVCIRLQIDLNLVDVYVFPSAELNGFCYVDELPITVGISSTLVKSLKGEELAFVLGHEIGHALFRETTNFSANPECLEDQMFSRSVELSVDRIGLLAAGNYDAAFRAILKTLSGLNDEQLRFDFSQFMAEANATLKNGVGANQLYSSHPPLALRFKALVTFSSCDIYLSRKGADTAGSLSIEHVNKVVMANLDGSVDGMAKDILDKSLSELAVWLACFLIHGKQKVSISSFEAICRVPLKRADIEKGMGLLGGYSSNEASVLLKEKVEGSMRDCLRLGPRITSKFIDRLKVAFPSLSIVSI